MPWYDPLPTLTNGGTPTHTDLNKFRDNGEWLHALPKDSHVQTSDTDLTTTATTWASISANFEKTLVTSGGNVLALIELSITNLEIDLDVDGTRLGSTPATTGAGIARVELQRRSLFLPIFLDNLSAASHTFKVMWKATSGTGTIFGALRPRFYVRQL